MAHSRTLFLFCVFSTVNSKYVHFDSIRTADLWYQKCLLCRLSHNHRHLREIGCSLAIVGGPAAGAECGGKSTQLPLIWCKKCFIAAAAAGNITTTVNKGRPGRPMSSLLLLDVYGHNPKMFFVSFPVVVE